MNVFKYLDVTINLNDGTYKPYTNQATKLNTYTKSRTIHQAPYGKSHYL